MKLIGFTALVCLTSLALAQEVHFDYDRAANFGDYRTYEWASNGPGTNQLMDQNIRQAIDSQMALKGLRRVDSGGDLKVIYHAAISQEKQLDSWGTGPRFWGSTRVTTSTIENGKLTVDLVDPGRDQLVWRGVVGKTLDISKDPEKNHKNLQKAVAKLFKNYPPGSGK